MASNMYRARQTPSASTSGESGYSRSISGSTFSLPMSMKEVGEYLVDLAPKVQQAQNERQNMHAKIGRIRDCYRQLLTECGRNVEEGMKQLEDESEEDPNMLGKTEPPQSAMFLHNELESVGEYLRRQESSEKTIVSRGKCFRTPGETREGDGSLQCAEECSEHVSEREGQLQSQVIELQATIDELSRQLAKAHITYPEADLSSDKVSESLSRVEEAVLIRSQSVPEQLLVAHKKIEVLEEVYDNLMEEKKDAESKLEASLKTVQNLDESIEEERLEKYSALQNVKQLKTELEGLKEQAAKKPVQKTEGDTHTCLPSSSAREEGLLMSELKTLLIKLAYVKEDLAQATERANFTQEERRDMKEQLDHTVAEKLQLEEKVERLPHAEADADRAQERREMKEQLDRTVAEKLLLEKKVERLPQAEADANRAQQERREMKEQLDRTVAEKLLLEDQLADQKKAAKDWKMKLDETTCKLIQKEDEVNMLRGR